MMMLRVETGRVGRSGRPSWASVEWAGRVRHPSSYALLVGTAAEHEGGTWRGPEVAVASPWRPGNGHARGQGLERPPVGLACDHLGMPWSGGDALALLELLREHGLVALIKADGERTSSQWTVMVTGEPLSGRHVRVDHHDVGAALDLVVEELQRLMGDSFPSAHHAR